VESDIKASDFRWRSLYYDGWHRTGRPVILSLQVGAMVDDVWERTTCAAGDTVFREGDAANQAYIVQEGEVAIEKLVEGKIKVLGTIVRGGIFGEMGLVDDSPRMATARAKTGVTLIIVSRRMFSKKLNKTDPFIRSLLNIFVDNIRTSNASSNNPAAEVPTEAEEG
jgi:CRP/FNR family cyclic AMP-dependent transcriptional regulator